MIKRFIVFAVIALALLFLGLLLYKSYQSHYMEGDVGIIDGKLKACSKKPNCVSSFSPADDKQHYFPAFEGNIQILWGHLPETLEQMNLKIVTMDAQYIHATETTKIMRFVDDVEFLLSEGDEKIHVRSASRVGRSDLGANRKRMEKIKTELYKKVSGSNK